MSNIRSMGISNILHVERVSTFRMISHILCFIKKNCQKLRVFMYLWKI